LKGVGQALLAIALVFAGVVALNLGIHETIGVGTIESSSGKTGAASSAPEEERSSEETGSPNETQQSGQPAFGEPEPTPENGTWWDNTSDRRIAPLKISVSSDEHYYIKVVDAYSEVSVLALFVRSGRTAQIEVPTGTYRLKYAVGDTWYGQEQLFGPDTRYLEAEDTFTFEVVGQRVRGHEVELILQQNGNLRTDQIPQSEF
jgi:hypothetical protein